MAERCSLHLSPKGSTSRGRCRARSRGTRPMAYRPWPDAWGGNRACMHEAAPLKQVWTTGTARCASAPLTGRCRENVSIRGAHHLGLGGTVAWGRLGMSSRQGTTNHGRPGPLNRPAGRSGLGRAVLPRPVLSCPVRRPNRNQTRSRCPTKPSGSRTSLEGRLRPCCDAHPDRPEPFRAPFLREIRSAARFGFQIPVRPSPPGWGP